MKNNNTKTNNDKKIHKNKQKGTSRPKLQAGQTEQKRTETI